jgi:hypothetical protein
LPIINGWGDNVAVYELTEAAVVDVRHTLLFRPTIYVGSQNATIHTNIFDFARIPNYTVGPDTAVTSTTCASLVTQAHTNSPAAILGIKSFIQNGGNLMTQCLAANTYENHANGRFQSTGGFTISNVDTALTYPNGDMPFSQFIGALASAPGGSEQDWTLASGSVFHNNSHSIAQNSGAHTDKFAATAAKLFYGGPGGMVYVLGGHNYGAGGTNLATINGQRMLLNSVFTPSTRPSSCGITFGPTSASVSFTGIVRDIDRSPIRNVRLTLINIETSETRHATTNNFGHFRFDGLAILNTYIVYISSKGYEFPNNGTSFTPADDFHMEFVGSSSSNDPLPGSPKADQSTKQEPGPARRTPLKFRMR